jgi:hypothetical protein
LGLAHFIEPSCDLIVFLLLRSTIASTSAAVRGFACEVGTALAGVDAAFDGAEFFAKRIAIADTTQNTMPTVVDKAMM